MKTILKKNKEWAAYQLEQDPNYFKNLSLPQRPHALWISCSDARVEAGQITGQKPGEMFVHRNIANVVHHSDFNCMSVIQYAVEALRIHDIIVCGHTQCGGVQYAMSRKYGGMITHWLRAVMDTYDEHSHELEQISDQALLERRVAELNTLKSCERIAQTGFVQAAWARCDSWRQDRLPRIHAWMFDMSNGELYDVNFGPKNEEGELVQFAGRLGTP